MTRFILLVLSAVFGAGFIWAVATEHDAMAIAFAVVEMALGAFAVAGRKPGQHPHSRPRSKHYDR